MAIQADTKDCTALTDSELAEMADLCAEGPTPHEIGVISKAAEEWVLVTQVRDGNKLRAFSFSTLERIGGTPSVLIGLGSVLRTSKRDAALRALMSEQYRRALMAFPDEDVLVGTRLNDAGGYEAYKALQDIVPRPGYKPSGEDRAWGRRLAKRFGVDASLYDDKAFRVTGDGTTPKVLDHESLKPEKIDAAVAAQFSDLDIARGDCLIVFGWAMSEELVKYGD